MEHPSLGIMWEKYIKRVHHDNLRNATYTSWHFCNDERCANELAVLVNDGVKTGTSSLHLLYELEGEELPVVGEYNIVTDWDGVAQAIIQIVQVEIIPFSEVTDDFAYKEGEGDRSLMYWRDVHIDFFTTELSALDKPFTEDLLIVCMEFKMVYTSK